MATLAKHSLWHEASNSSTALSVKTTEEAAQQKFVPHFRGLKQISHNTTRQDSHLKTLQSYPFHLTRPTTHSASPAKQYFHNTTGLLFLPWRYIIPGITDRQGYAKSSSALPESGWDTLGEQRLSFPPSDLVGNPDTHCLHFYCMCLSAFAEHLSPQCKPIWL